MIEETALQAMQYFSKTLSPQDKGWDILEINAGGCKEFFNLFGKGNNYSCASLVNVGGLEYYIQREDLSELPEIKDKQFDLVIHTLTLQSTWDYKKSIQECFRILKEGGFLLINCPWICENRGNDDYWRISHHALSRMLEESGFDHGRVAMWNDSLTSGIARRPNDSKT